MEQEAGGIASELHRLGQLSTSAGWESRVPPATVLIVNVRELVDTILYEFRDDLDKAAAYCRQKGCEDGPVMALAYAEAGQRIRRTIEGTYPAEPLRH